jgi:rSAM/selenodomain-associated transferase 1
MTALLVLAKEPRPGRVKTRLVPPCTPVEAAALAEAALRDTLDVAARSRGAGRLVLVLDGSAPAWLASGVEVIAQRGGGLAERLAAAFADAGEPAFLIGMDTPQITSALIDAGLAAVEHADAAFGPAADGGYWGIGLRRADDAVFRGVPMSEPGTGAAQLRRLLALGLRTSLLPQLRDVDTIADAHAVAAVAPRSRFARALRGLAEVAA